MSCLLDVDLDELVTLRQCFVLCALSSVVSCVVTMAMVARRVTWRSG